MKKFVVFILLAAVILSLLPHARANTPQFGQIMSEYFLKARISEEVLTNFGFEKAKKCSLTRRVIEFHNIFSEGDVVPQYFAKRAHYFENLIKMELMISGSVSQQAIDQAAEDAFKVNGMVLSPNNIEEFRQLSELQNAPRGPVALVDTNLDRSQYITNVPSAYFAHQINSLLFGTKTPSKRLLSLPGRELCEVMLRNNLEQDSLEIDINGSVLKFGMTASEEIKHSIEGLLVTALFKATGTKFFVKKHLAGRIPVATFGIIQKDGSTLKSCTVRL